MDVKTNTGLVVSVEAVKKPESANKVQELAAMEEALKKATEEAHKQCVRPSRWRSGAAWRQNMPTKPANKVSCHLRHEAAANNSAIFAMSVGGW